MTPFEFGQFMGRAVKQAVDHRAMMVASPTSGAAKNTGLVGGKVKSITPEYGYQPTVKERQESSARLRQGAGNIATDAYYNMYNNAKKVETMGNLATGAPVVGSLLGAVTGQPELGTLAGMAGSGLMRFGQLDHAAAQKNYQEQFQRARAGLEKVAPPVPNAENRYWSQYNEPANSTNYPWNR